MKYMLNNEGDLEKYFPTLYKCTTHSLEPCTIMKMLRALTNL